MDKYMENLGLRSDLKFCVIKFQQIEDRLQAIRESESPRDVYEDLGVVIRDLRVAKNQINDYYFGQSAC